MTSNLLAEFEYLRKPPELTTPSPESPSNSLTTDDVARAFKMARERARNDPFSRWTPYGWLTDFEPYEQLQRQAESSIRRCLDHKPPNCICWQFARNQLWNLRRRYSPEERAEINRRLGRPEKPKDPFDMHPEVITNTRSTREEYAEMLRDPEVRAELAQRDPAFAEQFKAEEIARVVAEFRRRNRDYLRTERNAAEVIQSLAKRHLDGIDWFDNEDASAALYDAGHWTVDELTAQFKKSLKAGRLDVKPGTTKSLTREEQLQVIASIRGNTPEVAIIKYLEFALGGLPFEFNQDPNKWMATHSKVCSDAALFVWRNSKVGIDPDEFKEFQESQLSRTPLLTFTLIDEAWTDWQKAKQRSHLLGAVENFKQQVAEPKDLDSLSDAELDRRILQAREDARRNR